MVVEGGAQGRKPLLRGEVVRGKASLTARLKSDAIELPPNYRDDSFFTVQGQETAIG